MQDSGRFQKTTLSNGVRVLSELHPESRALCLASTIGVGSRDESRSQIGISHFLEHMVFKGSQTRSALQIVKTLEAVGGEVNAYTSKEHTTYHSLTLSEDWKLGVSVLADLSSRAVFPEKDFDRERSVVLQEINSAKDFFEESIFDVFYEKIFHEDPLGWPILGFEKTLAGIDRKKLLSYYNKNYRASNMIVSAAGKVDHDKLVVAVEKEFSQLSRLPVKNVRTTPKYRRVVEFIKKPTEQSHILLGFPTCSYRSKNRFAAYFINTLLGGGMTSKLYQAVREKKGLVYSIYSQLQTYTDSGMLMIYAATEPEKTMDVLKEIGQVLSKVKAKGISKQDLKLYKTQVRGNIVIGAEDIENRMNSLAVNEMVFGRYRSVDEILSEIEKVDIAAVNKLVTKDIKQNRMSLLVMGPGFGKGAKFEGKETQALKEILNAAYDC